MKLTLGLCTSGSSLKLSVHNGEKYFNFSQKLLNQEELFFKEIERLAKKAGGGFGDFARICLVNGPGRFTGMRISYSFAGIYGRLSGAGLYGVSVFDVLAYGFYEREGLSGAPDLELSVITRAFKDEFYFCGYSINGGRMRQSSVPVWMKERDVREKLAAKNALVIGDAEEFGEIYGLAPGLPRADASVSRLRPENIIKAALYFKKKEIRPMYLKPAKYELA